MSSYIFNSRRQKAFKRYLITLLVFGLAFWASLFAGQQVIFPPRGDLTRLGGYEENRFTPSMIQKTFHKKLFDHRLRKKNQLMEYDRYYDVVVLGSSFSNGGGSVFWQNYFIKQFDASLLTFHFWHYTIEDLLESEGFKKFPPRLIIYNPSEREYKTIINYRGNYECVPDKRLQKHFSVELPLQKKLKQPTFDHWMSTPPKEPISQVQLLNFIKKKFRRQIWLDNSQVVRTRLNTPDIFTNERSTDMLIFHSYLYPRESNNFMLKAQCGALAMQQDAEANGKTRFVMMLAPGKMNVYKKYLANPEDAELTRYYALVATKGLNSVDLLKALRKAANDGEQDIYWPADTHWAPKGAEIAAAALTDYLFNQGIVKPVE